ncbi:MAG: WYL domain-containing protein [Acidobacteria bacterium]|nr:WYL domain-containing protein [Acidobacteriota bacterium]
MSSLDRIYALHRTLSSRRHAVSASELMEELGCSRSTLFRAIAHLRDHLGAPIDNVPGQGYLYNRDDDPYELPGLWLRRDELEALLVMDELLSRVQPGLLEEHVAPLRKRVRSLLDRGRQGGESFPAHRFRILRAHGRDVATPAFLAVATAVVERRRIAFDYTARTTGETTRRRTSPQRLVYYRDQWYLDGWDEDRDSLRTYALDRVESPEAIGDAGREVSEEDLIEAFGAGYGLFSGALRGRARLRFQPERARWVADERWHSRQKATRLPDGRLELVVPYSEVEELLGEILRHGPDVEVLEPPELVELVKQQLKQAVEAYE